MVCILGLHYYGLRYYDPATCRWLNRDPIAESGGSNLFAFINNDPVNNIDYLGLEIINKKIINGIPMVNDARLGRDGLCGIFGKLKLIDNWRKATPEEMELYFKRSVSGDIIPQDSGDMIRNFVNTMHSIKQSGDKVIAAHAGIYAVAVGGAYILPEAAPYLVQSGKFLSKIATHPRLISSLKIFTAGGSVATVGKGGIEGILTISSGEYQFGSPESYAGTFIGGGVTAVTGFWGFSTPGSLLTGSFGGSFAKQSFRALKTHKYEISSLELTSDTLSGTIFGFIAAGVKLPKITGMSKGRGCDLAVLYSVKSRFASGAINRLSGKTIKRFVKISTTQSLLTFPINIIGDKINNSIQQNTKFIIVTTASGDSFIIPLEK